MYVCTDLRIRQICRRIRDKYRFQYNLESVFTGLVYARILCPSSKLSSYEYCRHLPEPPKYGMEDVCRALSVIAKESDFIQSELYRNPGFQTDYEYITRSKMRSIIKTTREVTASSQRKFQKIAKRKKYSTIETIKELAISPISKGLVASFISSNCQRREYTATL